MNLFVRSNEAMNNRYNYRSSPRSRLLILILTGMAGLGALLCGAMAAGPEATEQEQPAFSGDDAGQAAKRAYAHYQALREKYPKEKIARKVWGHGFFDL
jgi:hypothetical protein